MSGQAVLQPEAWQQLLTLAVTSAIVMGSPGPATISVSAVGAAFGLRGSLPYTLGIVAGTIAVLLVVAGGIATLVRSMPELEAVLSPLPPPTFSTLRSGSPRRRRLRRPPSGPAVQLLSEGRYWPWPTPRPMWRSPPC